MYLPKNPFFLLLVCLAGCSVAKKQEQGEGLRVQSSAATALRYPKTRKVDHVDVYHGVKVADPYRWLEENNSDEVRAWVEAQNKLCFGYLEKIEARDRIKARLTKIWNYPRSGVPTVAGGRYYFRKNDGLQNQSLLLVADSPLGEAKVFLDPNKLSKDGTVALKSTYFSRDGKYMAYSISDAGSDWTKIRIRDTRTGVDLPDVLSWVKFSPAEWLADGSGFFYNRFPTPARGKELASSNFKQKIYFHKLGTSQAQDVLVHEDKTNEKLRFWPVVSDDGIYLVLYVYEGGNSNAIHYKELAKKSSEFVTLIDFMDASFDFLGNDGTRFYFRSDLDAPKSKIIAIDIDKPQQRNWELLVKEAANTISDSSIIGDRFVVRYLKDARAEIKLFKLDGSFERDLPLPTMGRAFGFTGRRKDKETFFGFTSFTFPTTIFRYDFASGASSVVHAPKIEVDADAYVTKQVRYESRDGSMIPMFIVHRKGLTLNGKNPVYLYGYGGFNIPMSPFFSVANLVWMEMGGVYAMPNLRGGGEFGEKWHKSGTKLKKQNVFDDFIAAASWLIDRGYTSKQKLAIAGGSNGGLLVGACMVQRPDLFAVALPAVGVMDMLRFHKFTIGHAWVSDYGSSDDPEEFKALLAYSPYHRLRKGVAYPATLVTTADHDDRVVPAHSYKFIAALQERHAGKAPVLIRIETSAGHGAGTPTMKRILEVADKWTFLVENLGMTLPASFD